MNFHFLNRAVSIELSPFREAQFWLVDLQKIQKTESFYAEKLLDNSTLERVKKIISEEGRNRAIVTYAILRFYLGKLLCEEPEKITFLTNKFGKPYVKNQSAYFNISHTKEFAFIAFHPNRPIGVDIENINNPIDALKLAKHFMSPNERKILLNNPSQVNDYFFSFWCAKEAFLKAVGSGLLTKKIPEISPRFDESGSIHSFHLKNSQEIYLYNQKTNHHKLAVCVIQKKNELTVLS